MSKTVNHPRQVYTRLGKWYGIVSLGIIFLYPLAHTALITVPALQMGSGSYFAGFLVLSLLFMLFIVIAILGIVKEKVWARWMAIAIYGFIILRGISILTHVAFTSSDATSLWILVNVLLKNLPEIGMAFLGIILVWQKPKLQEDT